jgi:polyferredoxin
MKTALTFFIMGALSIAGGINLAMLALDDAPAVLWLTAGGSIACGVTCLISGFTQFDESLK